MSEIFRIILTCLCILLIILSIIYIIKQLIIYKKLKKQDQLISIRDFIDDIKNSKLFFIDISVKEDGNVIYYVNCAPVKRLDNKYFEWVILDYTKKDGSHTEVKLPTYALFLTLQEANAFLNGQFEPYSLDYVEEI